MSAKRSQLSTEAQARAEISALKAQVRSKGQTVKTMAAPMKSTRLYAALSIHTPW